MDDQQSIPLSNEVRAGVDSQSWPLVTIGLPVYNGEKTVKRALGSLLGQRYPNIEIIVSDNASTDRTMRICRKILRDHPNVRFIEHKVNRGPHANFKSVLDEARGEFFMWAADDDVWLSGFVSRMVHELRSHPDACVAMCATELRDENWRPVDIIRFVGPANPNALPPWRLGRLVLTPRKYNYFIYGLYRTEILRKGIKTFPAVLGGDRMFVAQFAIGHRFRYVDEVFYQRTDQSSHRNAYKREEAKSEVRLGQLTAFVRMLAETRVLSFWRKLGIPYYAAVYARFVYRKQIAKAEDYLAGAWRRLATVVQSVGLPVAIGLAAVMTLGLAATLSGLAPSMWGGRFAAGALLSATAWFLLQRRAAALALDAIHADVRGLRKDLDKERAEAKAARRRHHELSTAIVGLETSFTELTKLEQTLPGFIEHHVTEKVGRELQAIRTAMASDAAHLTKAVADTRSGVAADAHHALKHNLKPTLNEMLGVLRTRVAEDASAYFRKRFQPALGDLAALVRQRVAEDAQSRLDHVIMPALTGGISQNLNRIDQEMRYTTDLLLSPPETVEGFLDAPTGQYGANRRHQMRKEIQFARLLEQSRIRELFLHEIFPDIDGVSVPIGAVHELSGHPNKTDMMFVCAIAKLRQARNIFEFGTYQGRTTYHLVQATPETQVTTLDLPIEANERYGKFNGCYFRGKPMADRITQLFEDSRNLDLEVHRGKYDFIFVDGDHSYDLVKNDTTLALDMLKPGGAIMWHDYAPKSDRLVEFIRDFTNEQKPLFRIRRTCLLLHIDGVDPLSFEAAPLESSLESEGLAAEPHRVEEIYHH